MATSSDNRTSIDRESLKIGLVDRYLAAKQPAGGAFSPVQTNVKVNGSNRLSIGNSSYDNDYTVTRGFRIQQPMMTTELKDAANGVSSLQLSRYISGFNSRKYTNGGFSR